MQLVNIEVGHHPASGLVTVDFQREGGEIVSVKMAADALDEDVAIARAKALMVQLATFGDDPDPAQDERLKDGDAPSSAA